MKISASQVKELRQSTGIGIMEAKEVLIEANGDINTAHDILKERGQKFAAKKADRQAEEGVVGVYLHNNKKIAAMIEVFCETDFVAKNEDFIDFAQDLAMQVAAMEPIVVNIEDLKKDEDLGDRKKEDVCLMTQKFFKDESKTMQDLTQEMIAKLGENIRIGDFIRYKI